MFSDGCIRVTNGSCGSFRPSQLKTEFLALLSVTFVSENNIVAAVRVPYAVASSSCHTQDHVFLLLLLF